MRWDNSGTTPPLIRALGIERLALYLDQHRSPRWITLNDVISPYNGLGLLHVAPMLCTPVCNGDDVVAHADHVVIGLIGATPMSQVEDLCNKKCTQGGGGAKLARWRAGKGAPSIFQKSITHI